MTIFASHRSQKILKIVVSAHLITHCKQCHDFLLCAGAYDGFGDSMESDSTASKAKTKKTQDELDAELMAELDLSDSEANAISAEFEGSLTSLSRRSHDHDLCSHRVFPTGEQ